MSPYLYAGNRRLLAVVLGLAAGLCLAWGGPLGDYCRDLAVVHADKSREFELWQRDFRNYRPIAPDEREQWLRDFRSLSAWIPVVSGDPELVAEVARAVQTPSTLDLQVQRSDVSADSPLSLDVAGFADAATLSVRGVPVTVRFRCRHHDLDALLARIERKNVPAWLESVQMKRLLGDIEVQMQMVFFVRATSETRS